MEYEECLDDPVKVWPVSSGHLDAVLWSASAIKNFNELGTLFKLSHNRVKSAPGSFIKLSNPNWSVQINFWRDCPKSDQTRIKVEDTMYLRPFIRLWEISFGEIMVMFCIVTSKVIFWRQRCSIALFGRKSRESILFWVSEFLSFLLNCKNGWRFSWPWRKTQSNCSWWADYWKLYFYHDCSAKGPKSLI